MAACKISPSFELGIRVERSRQLGLQAIAAFRRFISLYRRYSENQPRGHDGRWVDAGLDVEATSSITPTENDAATGDLEIDSITEKLLEKLAGVLDMLGPGSGAVHGTAVHAAFAEAVRRSGIPNLEVERSWLGAMAVLEYGIEGSIRTDVVLRGYDDAVGVRAVWDLKTGNAVLTTSRAAKIRAAVGIGQSVPLIQLSNSRGIRFKAAFCYLQEGVHAQNRLRDRHCREANHFGMAEGGRCAELPRPIGSRPVADRRERKDNSL